MVCCPLYSQETSNFLGASSVPRIAIAGPESPSEVQEASRQDERSKLQSDVASRTQEPVSDPGTSDPNESAPAQDTESDPAESADPEMSPCKSEDQPPAAWLDRVQAGVYEAVCGSAFWFDSFFGSAQDSETRHDTYGRLSLKFRYDSIGGLDPKLRLRAHTSLPRFENKVQAIVGRADEDELLRDETTEFQDQTPSLRDSEDEWLLGLGYRPFGGSKRQLDFTGGVNIRFPLDPFVAARYRRHYVLGSSTLVRARHTLFWRNEKGVGVSTRLDLDRSLTKNHLLRWTSGATHAEETLGVDWYTRLSLFQNLREGEAVAYQVYWRGETDAPVAIEELGVQARYRKQVLREWFFLQVSPGIIWRREDPLESRKAVPVIGFGFEMLFGSRPGEINPLPSSSPEPVANQLDVLPGRSLPGGVP